MTTLIGPAEAARHAASRDPAPRAYRCRLCGGAVREVLDLGRQPISNAFVHPEDVAAVGFFRLAVGLCTSCTLVQQLAEVPRSRMFRPDYPYRASGSALIRRHFADVARRLVPATLQGRDPFVVEIGSNDGVMLRTLRDDGVRHLGVDPAVDAAHVARSHGIHVRTDFFEESSAAEIRAEHGPAHVVFSANTISHIAYLDSILRGLDLLLAPDGIVVFEDRYLGDILRFTYFDQIYDEHFYLFSVGAVRAVAARFGFELVDAEHLGVHGGSMRYTLARPGMRPVSPRVAAFLAREVVDGLADEATFARFAVDVERIRDDLVTLLRDLRSAGRRVIGYGATSRSATVTNFCGIGPDLVPMVCDSTPEKQGRLSPGSRIPVRPPAAFADPYPDFALLFAWNHAEEIMAKESSFRARGGRWILYAPRVHLR